MNNKKTDWDILDNGKALWFQAQSKSHSSLQFLCSFPYCNKKR